MCFLEIGDLVMTYSFQIGAPPASPMIDPEITKDHLPQDFRYYSLVVTDYSRRQMAALVDIISRYVNGLLEVTC